MVRSATKKHTGKDPDYLAFIHQFRCIVCSRGVPEPTLGTVEAHHAGPRGMGQRADDHTAVPLCRGHHVLKPDAAHELGKKFWEHHGLDRDRVISMFNDLWEEETQNGRNPR